MPITLADIRRRQGERVAVVRASRLRPDGARACCRERVVRHFLMPLAAANAAFEDAEPDNLSARVPVRRSELRFRPGGDGVACRRRRTGHRVSIDRGRQDRRGCRCFAFGRRSFHGVGWLSVSAEPSGPMFGCCAFTRWWRGRPSVRWDQLLMRMRPSSVLVPLVAVAEATILPSGWMATSWPMSEPAAKSMMSVPPVPKLVSRAPSVW